MKRNILLIVMGACISVLYAQNGLENLHEAKMLKDKGDYLNASKFYHNYRISNKLTDKELMNVLLPEAECYYMLDDYQQLDSLTALYLDVFKNSRNELGDSLNVYKAYLHKLIGNALYPYVSGENDNKAEYIANKHYEQSLNIFEARNSVNNVVVLHQEIAHLKYKAKDYEKAYRHLDEVFNYYRNRLELGINSDEPRYYSLLSQMAICNAKIASIEEDDAKAKEIFAQSLSQIDQAISFVSKKKSKDFFDRVRIKGKILIMQYDRLNIDRRNEARDFYSQYVEYQRKTVKERLSLMTESQQEQNWLALHQFLFDCYRLGNGSSEMLYDLALFSKNYLLENKQTEDVKWQHVRKSLTDNDCAIEFV